MSDSPGNSPRKRTHQIRVWPILAVLFLLGCGGPGIVEILDTFQVTVMPDIVTVTQGESFDVVVTAHAPPTTGGNDHVVFSIIGDVPNTVEFVECDNFLLPTGRVEVNNMGSLDDATCTLRVTILPDATPGTYETRLRGDFVTSGSVDDDALRITVVAAAPVTIGVDVITTGEDLPENGYESVLTPLGSTNSRTQAVDINQQGEITFTDVDSGDYTLGLTGVPQNCSVQGDNPITIQIGRASSDLYTFNVVCVANAGAVVVANQTDGDAMAQAYSVAVDGGEPTDFPLDSDVSFDLPVGEHTIEVTNVPPHCFLIGPNPTNVTVEFGESQTVAYVIDCTEGRGTLRVITRTTGVSPDPDGYLVNVGSETIGFSNSPPPGFSHDFTLLPAGDHDVFLFDVAVNCVVANANRQDPGNFRRVVTVMVNEVTEVVFDIDCQTPALVCVGTPSIDIPDSTFLPADWQSAVAYNVLAEAPWSVTGEGQQTTPGPGSTPAGNPPSSRWVQMSVDNPGELDSGGGIANEHIPARISGGFTSVRVEFDVWSNSARVQAYLKDTQNDTYYGIPRGRIISEADGWVRMESECAVPTGMAKMGGQTG